MFDGFIQLIWEILEILIEGIFHFDWESFAQLIEGFERF